MTDSQKIEAAIAAVLAGYLEFFAPLTTKQVAQRMGVSAKAALAALNDAFHLDKGWTRIALADCYINVIEPNYRTVKCTRKVQGWTVTREYLAKMLLATRERVQEVALHAAQGRLQNARDDKSNLDTRIRLHGRNTLADLPAVEGWSWEHPGFWSFTSKEHTYALGDVNGPISVDIYDVTGATIYATKNLGTLLDAHKFMQEVARG